MTQIRDKLSEAITLKNPRVLLGEFIPCDRNILEAIAQKVMASRELEGEFVTTLMDEFPDKTIFHSEPECNSIRIKNYVPSEYIACEASIQDPTDVNIDQEELLGIYLNHEGHVVYGAEIIQVDEADAGIVSLDKMARIVIDLATDTSLLLDTLLTHHQRRLVDCVFKGSSASRYKFVGIMAESITPFFDDPEEYKDDEIYQNEIEQILNNLVIVHRSEKDGTIFLVGDSGIIVVSPNWKDYETLVSFFSLIRSSEIFVDTLYHRMSLLWDELGGVRRLIDKTTEGNYSVITKAQNILAEASANFTIIKSVGGYLTRGFKLITKRWDDINSCIDQELCDIINLGESFHRLLKRIEDVHIDIESLSSEVEGLQTLLSTQIEQQMRRVYWALRDNTRSTSDMIRANERTGNVLDVIQLILSGTIAFDIVVTLTGEYVTDLALFPTENPFLFFGLAIVLWLVIVIVLKRGMDWLESKVEKSHMMRMTINSKCDIESLEAYLSGIEKVSVDEEFSNERESVRVHYLHPVEDNAADVKVTLSYDRKNRFVQDVVVDTQAENIEKYRDEIMKAISTYCIDDE